MATELGGEHSGAVTDAMNTAGLLGGTVTSVGFGYLIGWFGSYTLPVIILGILLLVGAFLWLLIKADQRLN